MIFTKVYVIIFKTILRSLHMQKTLAKLFDVHPNTITNWKKENKKGFLLFQKYFTKEDIEEFLETGSISKLEKKNANQYFIEIFHSFLSKFEMMNFLDLYHFVQAVDDATTNKEQMPAKEKIFNSALTYDFQNKQILMFIAQMEEYFASWLFSQHKEHYREIETTISGNEDILLYILCFKALLKNQDYAILKNSLKNQEDYVDVAWGNPYTTTQLLKTKEQLEL